jgi:hypothetical protein
LVQPENARKLKPQSLSAVFKRFPVLKEKCNIIEAEAEWRRQSNLSVTDFRVSTREEIYKMTPDNNWKQVFSSKDSSSERRFPNLLPCISLLLCLPFSNAPAERVFSHV